MTRARAALGQGWGRVGQGLQKPSRPCEMQLSALICDQELELRKVDPETREGERKEKQETLGPGSFTGSPLKTGKRGETSAGGPPLWAHPAPPKQLLTMLVKSGCRSVSISPANRRLDCSWLQGSPVGASGVVQTLTVKMRHQGPSSTPGDPYLPCQHCPGLSHTGPPAQRAGGALLAGRRPVQGPEAGAGCGGWGASGHLKGGLTALEDELPVCVEGQRSPGWCWTRSLAGVLGARLPRLRRGLCVWGGVLAPRLGQEGTACAEGVTGGPGSWRSSPFTCISFFLLFLHIFCFVFKFPCSEVQVCRS